MKENDVIEVTITDDNHNGNGIAKINDFPIFIPRVVTNDKVKIRITKLTKKYALGELVQFVSKSKSHQKPLCPYYKECGGCDLLHITYERECELKQKYIEKLFKNIPCKFTYFERNNYRNKVTLHVKDQEIGYYMANSNKLIPVKECLLLEPEIDALIKYLKTIDLSEINEIVIKKGSEELLLSFSGNIKNKDILGLIKYQGLASIYLNNILIYGKPYIKTNLRNYSYNINANSFFQVNTKCATFMYDKVKEYIKSADKLLDLYCGMASIGIYLSDIAKEVVGIEINKDSVKCAKENIKDNKISNYKIIRKDASLISNDNYDKVVVDPPRSGLSKKVITSLNKMSPQNIIYISCNPSTLKRDIELLTSYELKEMSIFNMFPGTKHVECVSLLSLKGTQES